MNGQDRFLLALLALLLFRAASTPRAGVDIAAASCPKILAGLHPKPRLPFAALVVCAPGARLMPPAPP
jgi:hypothetical protein